MSEGNEASGLQGFGRGIRVEREGGGGRRRRREKARRGAAVQALGWDQSDRGESHLAEHEAEEVADYGATALSATVGDVGALEGS